MVDLRKDLSELKKMDRQQKLMLTAVFLGMFLLSFAGGVFLQTRQKAIPTPVRTTVQEPTVTPTPTPETTFAISPAKQPLTVGDPISVAVQLFGKPADTVAVRLNYDPAVFAADNLENGELFTNVLKEEIEKGTIRYAASLDLATREATKTGTLFTFELEPLTAASKSAVIFHPGASEAAVNGKTLRLDFTNATYSVFENTP